MERIMRFIMKFHTTVELGMVTETCSVTETTALLETWCIIHQYSLWRIVYNYNMTLWPTNLWLSIRLLLCEIIQCERNLVWILCFIGLRAVGTVGVAYTFDYSSNIVRGWMNFTTEICRCPWVNQHIMIVGFCLLHRNFWTSSQPETINQCSELLKRATFGTVLLTPVNINSQQ